MDLKELRPSLQQDIASASGVHRMTIPKLSEGLEEELKPVEEAKTGEENAGNVKEKEDKKDAKPEQADVESATAADTYRNAQRLSTEDWSEIIATNKLLHGFQIRPQVPDVVRARRPAFVLSNPENTPGGVKPCFQVADGSSIQVHEANNAFQSSLAQNAFSKTCIDTQLSAGDMGIQVGVSGSRGVEHSTSNQSSQRSQGQEYHASYKFPRARVFLDEYELEISDECNTQLEYVEDNRDMSSLREFEIKYGHVFVTSVVLGGQQRTVKAAGAMEQKTDVQRQDAVRMALGAQVLAPYVSASFKSSRERGTSSTHKEDLYADLSFLGMSANGGDTLIGSDVPNWAKTVASHENWRVIENETAVPLANLLALVTHKPWIPWLFLWIRKGKPDKLGQLSPSEQTKFSNWLADNSQHDEYND
ncbi:hypothetical protein BX600DRAFT_265923 [Xylariales sp. PMI_506]|nr:hypothetical protein BX600DRAFT_265923 [Xylariales sp. PMI_506]